MRIASVILAITVLSPFTARADAFDALPMPITSTVPAAGATLVQGTSVAFEVQTTLGCYIGTMSLKLVAQDGSTALSTTLSFGRMYPNLPWPATPGVYSWSVSCSAYRGDGSLIKDDYVSPTFGLTVTEAPVKSLLPDDGASFAPGTSLFGQFQLRTDRADLTCGSLGSRVEVSAQPILGQDGTLADDFKLAELFVARSDAFPDLYRDVAGLGRTAYAWTSTPGRYYWQMIVCGLKLPVRAVTIAAPSVAPAPPKPISGPSPRTLSVSEARSAAGKSLRTRVAYRRGTGRAMTCSRLSRLSVRCKATWRYHRAAFRGTVKVTATSDEKLSIKSSVRRAK
jgi:hypothetical protein